MNAARGRIAVRKPRYEHSGYLCRALERRERKKTISKVVKILRAYNFDAIAFRGMSGALVAPVIADRMGKTLIMVRKDESTHSEKRTEGDKGARRYVIVDDLVDSGATVGAIKDAMRVFAPQAICIGVVQYNKLYYYDDTSEPLGYTDVPEELEMLKRREEEQTREASARAKVVLEQPLAPGMSVPFFRYASWVVPE